MIRIAGIPIVAARLKEAQTPKLTSVGKSKKRSRLTARMGSAATQKKAKVA